MDSSMTAKGLVNYPQHRATVTGWFEMYRAVCGCGWTGPNRRGRDWAEADASRHNSEGTPQIPGPWMGPR